MTCTWCTVFRFLFSSSICVIRTVLATVPYWVSNLTFTLTAVHRYIIIVWNRHSIKFFSTKFQPVLVLSIWILSFVGVIPTVVNGHPVSFLWADNCFIFDASTSRDFTRAFDLCVTFAPMAVVFALNLHIYITIKRVSKAIKSARQTKGNKKETKIAAILFAFYVFYTIAHLPIILGGFINSQIDIHGKKVLSIVSWYCFFIVVAMNPVLHIVMFKEIRNSFLLLCNIKQNSVNSTQETSVEWLNNSSVIITSKMASIDTVLI